MESYKWIYPVVIVYLELNDGQAMARGAESSKLCPTCNLSGVKRASGRLCGYKNKNLIDQEELGWGIAVREYTDEQTNR